MVNESEMAAHLERFLRERGYVATVTVTHQGDARYFASSPTKVPIEVWQAAIDDLHTPSRLSRMMIVGT